MVEKGLWLRIMGKHLGALMVAVMRVIFFKKSSPTTKQGMIYRAICGVVSCEGQMPPLLFEPSHDSKWDFNGKESGDPIWKGDINMLTLWFHEYEYGHHLHCKPRKQSNFNRMVHNGQRCQNSQWEKLSHINPS